MFRYPPYYRLIVIVLRSRNDSILQELSVLYAENLRRRLGERVLGPVTPPITRVQTLHIRKIVLKIEIAAAIAPYVRYWNRYTLKCNATCRLSS